MVQLFDLEGQFIGGTPNAERATPQYSNKYYNRFKKYKAAYKFVKAVAKGAFVGKVAGEASELGKRKHNLDSADEPKGKKAKKSKRKNSKVSTMPYRRK